MQGKAGQADAGRAEDFIANILGDAERLEAMAQRLRELARAESLPQNERTELAPVIADLKSRFPASAIEASGRLDRVDRHVRGEGADRAVASRRQRDAAQARTIRLEADDDERTTLLVTVSNDGEPISAPNRDRIFDAFFTTRRDQAAPAWGWRSRAR